MTDIVVPFDWNPDNTDDDASVGTSYTVPSGKYAVARVSLSIVPRFEIGGATITPSDSIINTEAGQMTQTFHLTEGDIISLTEDATDTFSSSTGVVGFQDFKEITVTVNGGSGATNRMVCSCSASAVLTITANPSNDVGFTYQSNGLVHIEEYNVIT